MAIPALEQHNMETPRSSVWRSIHAISLLWIAVASSALVAFVTQTLLARALGPANFGLFASSLATVTIAAPFAGFGLSQFWLKAYGVEGWAASRWLGPSRAFVIASTAVTTVGVAAWVCVASSDSGVRVAVLALLPVIPGALASDLVGSKLRLEERHAALAGWQLVVPVGRLAVALVVVSFPAPTSSNAAVGYGAASLAAIAVAAPSLRALFRGNIRLHGHGEALQVVGATRPSLGELWAETWAYGLAVVLYPIFFQVGTVLLKHLSGDEQAGIFGVALAVMSAAYLLPVAVYQMFLNSKLHRWAAHDRARFWEVYAKGNAAMLALGILVGGLIAACAPWAVPMAFGKKYAAVVDVLALLSVCAPLRFLSSAVGSVLLTGTYVRFRAVAMAFAAAAAVALNLVMVPRFGAMGAASATAGSEAMLLVMMVLGARRLRRDDYASATIHGRAS